MKKAYISTLLSFSSIYILIVMFFPDYIYIIDNEDFPLITVRRLFISIWIFYQLIFYIFNLKMIRVHFVSLPYYIGVLIILFVLGIVNWHAIFRDQSTGQYISFAAECLFPAFIIWSSYKRKDCFNLMLKIFIYMYITVSIYGIIVYIKGDNFLIDYFKFNIISSRQLIYSYDNSTRLGIEGRAQAFFAHPIQFGYASSIILLLAVAVQQSDNLFLKKELIPISCILLASVFLSGSRSPLLLLIVCAGTYLFYLDVVNFSKIFFCILLASLLYLTVSIIFLNPLGRYYQLVGTIFEEIVQKGKDTNIADSSSFAMRLNQLSVAKSIFAERPIVGHGMAYMRYLLDNQLAPGLLGGESFAFKLLIETGLLGIIGYLSFYITIYFSYKRYLKEAEKAAILGISLLFGHIAFIFSTGDMNIIHIYIVIATLLLKHLSLSAQNEYSTGLKPTAF